MNWMQITFNLKEFIMKKLKQVKKIVKIAGVSIEGGACCYM